MIKNFVTVIAAVSLVATLTTSCEKETIVREITRDTTIVRSPTNMELLPGKWNTINHEMEVYTNNIQTSKKVEYFTGFYLDLSSNSNYSVKNQEGITSGKWELASANNLVFDKNTANERYFYILFVEPKTMALRGPFKKNGELKLSYLTTTYYQKP